jgi:uncharacterized protein (TIGR00297 family)
MLLLVLFILPQMGICLRKDAGRGDCTPAEGSRAGLISYPVSLLLLALIFHRHLNVVAAAWGVLALGDGLAGAVGERAGQHTIGYNPRKTWEGFFTFIVCGAAGAFFLMLWVSSAGSPLKVLAISIAAGLVGAFVESLPVRVGDNLNVPLVCGCFVFCAGLMTRGNLDSNLPYLGVRIILAVLIDLLLAYVAWKLRQITLSGAVAGFLLGTAVYMSFGYRSFLILLAFFVLGSAATRLGYQRKMARGIAEGRKGARGWREAVANLLAASFFSLLVITTPYQEAFLMALVAALAEAAGDTVSSETGKWASPAAWQITGFERVPPGESGGISLAGSAAGFGASALVVALASGLALVKGWEIGVVLVAAIAGNAADSLLGAVLERRGLLTNSFVNFAGTSLAGALALAWGLHH